MIGKTMTVAACLLLSGTAAFAAETVPLTVTNAGVLKVAGNGVTHAGGGYHGLRFKLNDAQFKSYEADLTTSLYKVRSFSVVGRPGTYEFATGLTASLNGFTSQAVTVAAKQTIKLANGNLDNSNVATFSFAESSPVIAKTDLYELSFSQSSQLLMINQDGVTRGNQTTVHTRLDGADRDTNFSPLITLTLEPVKEVSVAVPAEGEGPVSLSALLSGQDADDAILNLDFSAASGRTVQIDRSVALADLAIQGTGTAVVPKDVVLMVNRVTAAEGASVEVQTGGTLVLATPQADLSGLKVSGAGVVQCAMTENYGNNVAVPGFTGTVHVTSGYFTVPNAPAPNLALDDTVQMQTSVASSHTFGGNLTLNGAVALHCNNTKPLTVTGDITGNGTLIKKAADNLILNGKVEVSLTAEVAGNDKQIVVEYKGTDAQYTGATIPTLTMKGNGAPVKFVTNASVNNLNFETNAKAVEIADTAVLTLNGVKDAVVGSFAGTGTLRCTLTDDWNSRVIKLGDAFKGTTELMGGKLTLNGDTRIGSKLKMRGGALQTTVQGTQKLPALEVPEECTAAVYCNGGKHLAIDGGLSGEGTLQKRGGGMLTLNGESTLKRLEIGPSQRTATDTTPAPTGNVQVGNAGKLAIREVVVQGTTADRNLGLDMGAGSVLRIAGGSSYTLQGTNTKALTFSDGATIERVKDATAGLSADAIAVDGKVTVALVEPATAALQAKPADSLLTVLTAPNLDVRNFKASDEAGQTGWGTYVKGGNTLQLVNATDVLPSGGADAPAYSVKAVGDILNAATATTTTYSVVVGGEKKTMNANDVNAAYACFSGNMVNKVSDTELQVAYDFGISSMTIVTVDTTKYLIFTVKVAGKEGKETLTYGPATTLELCDTFVEGGTEKTVVLSAEEVTDAGAKTLGRSSQSSMRYLRLPLPAETNGHHYTVKAKASNVELGSVTVVTPSNSLPASGKIADGAVLMRMQPTTEQSSLSLRLTGAGTKEGQRYVLRRTSAAPANLMALGPTEIGEATMGADGWVVFKDITIPANTEVEVVAMDCVGSVTIEANSWDARGETIGQTVPIQSIIALTPREDFDLNVYPHISPNTSGKNESQYRIPGIATNGKGEVIAVYDIRWLSQDDLGVADNTKDGMWSPIDIGESYSADNGFVWNKPIIGIDVVNTYDIKTGQSTNGQGYKNIDRDLGDPCIVYDPETNAYFAMGITGGGLRGAGTNNDGNGLALYKRPAGANQAWTRAYGENNQDFETHVFDAMWNAAEEVSGGRKIASNTYANQQAFKNATKGVLDGPGHGFVTKQKIGAIEPGAIVFPMQWFPTGGNNGLFALYSIDGGKTWKATRTVNNSEKIRDSQENCIVELDDGSWYMIGKNGNAGQVDSDGRLLYRSTDGINWTEVGTKKHSNYVQGSIIRIGKDSQGRSRYAMSYSNQGGWNRSNLRIYFGTDMTKKNGSIQWDDDSTSMLIHEGPTNDGDDGAGKGYNSMCMLDEANNIIGYLYEANKNIYFIRIDMTSKLEGQPPVAP